MAAIYFFTDYNLLNVQIENYGPFIDGTSNPEYVGKDLFRVTSKHTGTCKAYAIMNGIIAAQKNEDNPTLINLIIKPSDKIDINLGRIAFIIYKGILKNSIISSSDPTIIANDNPDNKLTSKIWDSQNKYNIANDVTEQATISSIGYDLDSTITGFDDTDPIENLFTNSGSLLSSIDAGNYIGDFNPSGFGVEIIVENVGYTPQLRLTRNSETVIQVPSLTGTENDFQLFEHWNKKEEILNFLDPCALFGSHFKEGVQCKKDTDTKFSFKKGNDLYTNIVALFATRNTIYLDIRNQIGKSYNYLNYYGNHNSPNFKIGFGSGQPLQTKNYYNSLWPLFTFSNSDFVVSANSTDQEIINISLSTQTNTNPLLFLSFGYFTQSPNKFPKRDPKPKDRFVPLLDDDGYSQTLSVSIPNYEDNVVNLISSYARFNYYQKVSDTAPIGNLALKTEHPLNNTLQVNWMETPDEYSGKPIRIKVYNNELYTDLNDTLRMEAVNSTGIASDSHNNFTFFCSPKIKNDKSYPEKDIMDTITTAGIDGYEYFIDYLDAGFDRIDKVIDELFLTTGNMILANWKGRRGDRDLAEARGFYLLILDSDTRTKISDQLVSDFPLHNDYPVFLNLINEVKLLDEKGEPYYAYDLVLTGIKNIDDTAKMETVYVTEPSTSVNIKVYGL